VFWRYGWAGGWAGVCCLLWALSLRPRRLALFHSGVEKHWWEGLASCTGGTLQGLSGADLLNPALTIAAPVRCDEVPWEMIGLSMASWNGLASIALMVLWILAAKAR
jgi:disulfide bond formation protein DsbB